MPRQHSQPDAVRTLSVVVVVVAVAGLGQAAGHHETDGQPGDELHGVVGVEDIHAVLAAVVPTTAEVMIVASTAATYTANSSVLVEILMSLLLRTVSACVVWAVCAVMGAPVVGVRGRNGRVHQRSRF